MASYSSTRQRARLDDGQASGCQSAFVAQGSLLGLPQDVWVTYIVPMVARAHRYDLALELHRDDEEEGNLGPETQSDPPRMDMLSVINLSMVCRQAHRVAHETLGLRAAVTVRRCSDDGEMAGDDMYGEFSAARSGDADATTVQTQCEHGLDMSIAQDFSESYSVASAAQAATEAAGELEGLQQDFLAPIDELRLGAGGDAVPGGRQGRATPACARTSSMVRGMRAWHRVKYELKIPDPTCLNALLAALACEDTGRNPTQLPAWGMSVRKLVLGDDCPPVEHYDRDSHRYDAAGEAWSALPVMKLAAHFTAALRVLEMQYRPPTEPRDAMLDLLASCEQSEDIDDVDAGLLEAFVRVRPGLVKICYQVYGVPYLNPVTDHVLRALSKTCPDLRALSLYLYQPTFMHRVRNVEGIVQGACTDWGLKKLAAGCPKLEQLCLPYQPSIKTTRHIGALPLKRVWLSGCGRLKDVSGLAGVRDVWLPGCTSIADVSQLGLAHTLNLDDCYAVTDVTSLGEVRVLSLCSCPGVTDVVALAQVHNLGLIGCHNVSNVSALSQVHTLNLAGCRNVTDVSALGQLHALNLKGCQNVTDVSALGRISVLELEGCDNITDISTLGSVPYLSLPEHFAETEWMRGVSTIATGHESSIASIVEVGEWTVTCSADGTFKVCDLALEYITTVHADQGFPHSTALCDGCLATGGLDGSIKFWKQETWNCVRTLETGTGFVHDLLVHGNLLLSCGVGGTVCVWHIASWDCERLVQTGHTGDCTSLAVLDGKLYCGGGSADPTIRVIDMATWENVGIMEGHAGTVWQLLVLNGKVLSCSSDNTIKTWSTEGGHECEQTLEGHARSVRTIAVCGEKLISGSHDSSMRQWGMNEGTWQCERVHHSPHYGSVTFIMYSETMDYVLNGDSEGCVGVWETAA